MINNNLLTRKLFILLLFLMCSSVYAQRQTAAVAIGDSFISGEGAGNYMNVLGNGFPSWNGDDQSNPFFCHRSANASIFQANLPGIQRRFNLACSGGQPRDVTMSRPPSVANGRNMPPQLDQLLDVATEYDVKLILVGLGSNNRDFTFGKAAEGCIGKFLVDAYKIGHQDNGCTRADMASNQEFNNARNYVVEAVDDIIRGMSTLRGTNGQLLYPPGSFKIVMQDYTNPLPKNLNSRFNSEGGQTDTQAVFRKVAQERYRHGCTIHKAALDDGHWFSAKLGQMVAAAKVEISRRFPLHNVVYLNVQQAFDGARLCETTSLANALATPFHIRNSSGGVITHIDNRRSLVDLLNWLGVQLDLNLPINPADNGILALESHCEDNFQRCQEAWHPNERGHGVLGQCLAGAYQTSSNTIKCIRNWFSGQVMLLDPPPQVVGNLQHSVEWSYMPLYGRVMPELTLNYSLSVVDAGVPVDPFSWRIQPANHPQVLSIDRTYATDGSYTGVFRMIIDNNAQDINLGFGLKAELNNGREVIGGKTISFNPQDWRSSGPSLGD